MQINTTVSIKLICSRWQQITFLHICLLCVKRVANTQLGDVLLTIMKQVTRQEVLFSHFMSSYCSHLTVIIHTDHMIFFNRNFQNLLISCFN